MLNNEFKLKALGFAVSTAVLLTACGGKSSNHDSNDSSSDRSSDKKESSATLTRIATVPLGAEITGIYKTDNGELFFNVQHPADSLPAPENNAAVAAWNGVDFNNLPADFPGLDVPTSGSDYEKVTRVSQGTFQVLGRAGDTYAGALNFGFGAVVTADGSAMIKQSQDPDFNAFIPSNAEGTEGFLFSAWEDRPGGMSRLTLAKLDDGSWQVSDAMDVDFSAVRGTMINCFGTVSPWGTPLTSEENYEAENAQNWNNTGYTNGYPSYSDVQNIQAYLGGTFPNPYDYGYIVEITNPTTAAPAPVKHFTLGRTAHENAVIMPDQKTVYLTDDGTDKGFYKFVATNAGDLSAGTLYAAKVTQDAGQKDPATTGFDLSWIELGSSNNAQIATWIAEYNGIDETDYVADQTSYITDAEIADWAAGTSGDDRYAFLETLRAAEAKGATVEFRKMEGINVNLDGLADGSIPYMYVAMSEVRRGMADDAGDIQLDENRCGIVYQISLDGSYNATRMEPLVIGGEYDDAAAENKCPVDAIANPDNLIVLDDGRLIIGEDTSKHKNNMIWLYDGK